jgi:hypothetical protein
MLLEIVRMLLRLAWKYWRWEKCGMQHTPNELEAITAVGVK